MIRISTTTETPNVITIRIEGRLVGEWTDFARGELDRTAQLGQEIRLDLAELRYADAGGVGFIHELHDAGVDIMRASGFISELLHQEDG